VSRRSGTGRSGEAGTTIDAARPLRALAADGPFDLAERAATRGDGWTSRRPGARKSMDAGLGDNALTDLSALATLGAAGGAARSATGAKG